jgi:glutaconate CoA-transferase, subunit B
MTSGPPSAFGAEQSGNRQPPIDNRQYTASEMMIVAAARALAGVRTVFVGVGLPNIACNLAQRSVAPDLELIYEAGVYGARPTRLPLSIGDPTLVSGSISTMSMADLFGYYLQGGRIEVGLLGGAQIDRFGNLNTSVIGAYAKPKVRLPGSGGACEIATHVQRIFYIMRLSKRAFVEHLDFCTSPGFATGGDARNQLGLPGGGPRLVITDKALFDFDSADRAMRLISLHPGAALADVQQEIGWPIAVAGNVTETPAPSAADLRCIREELDPEGLYRK